MQLVTDNVSIAWETTWVRKCPVHIWRIIADRDFAVVTRVSLFHFNKFFAYKRNEAILHPFCMSFACSLQKFISLFSLLFASIFRFASTRLVSLQRETKGKRFFRFKINKNLSLLLRIFCFASKKHLFRIILLQNFRLV
jgi:hypothetical protein